MKKAIKTKTPGEELDSVKRGYNEKNPAQPQAPFKPDSAQPTNPSPTTPKKEKVLKRINKN